MFNAAGLVCPECGHDAGERKRLFRTRRRWRWIVAAALLVAAAGYSGQVRTRLIERDEPWRIALCPDTLLVAMLPYWDAIEPMHIDKRHHQSPLWRWQQRWLVRSVDAIVQREDNARAVMALNLLRLCITDEASREDDERVVRVLERAFADPKLRYDAKWILVSLGPRAIAARPTMLEWMSEGSYVLDVLNSFGPGQFAHDSDDDVIQFHIRMGTYRSGLRDMVLTEMVRRGGESFIEHLKRRTEKQRSLTELIALHRLQGRGDPVELTVELPDGSPWWITAKLTNVGDQPINVGSKGPFAFDELRWRFVIRRRDGSLVDAPPSEQPIGAGPVDAQWLAPGEHLTHEWVDSDEIAALPPGRYTLIVQYHEELSIKMDWFDPSELLLIESAPIEFDW